MKTLRTRSLSALLAAGILTGCAKKEADAPLALAPVSPATNQPATPTSPTFAKLQGKWLRPDGGYILEIRSAAPDGKMDAAYFNPKSINVAKAQASQNGGSLKVFIELRDANYPGSTYSLAYDPKTDQLKGDYFQAAIKETFDVFFTRMNGK